MLHFTKLVAVEYGKFGIRSNAIAPGTVRTQAWEARAAANPNVFEEARRWYPLQRVADPKDVANAVGFLASDQASAISGVCLPVDCGLTAGQAELARTFSQSADY
jgi:NAD(P)-dependent dehydrogenase (short-subunit alcohol dehydrogenase family)